ncbi:TetR/AcrR family transcriptional regulator (plasmid) [Tabrizicola piscis]|uniref:TetR/AcrR family transcriptional regulator n=1 Tax=Tabrizicola piscis TaxID=2494374 RepID=A0A3S8UCZ5_9RHOB|nr:TetR/AcrR family transcriptional regulator [Tabrizicola piscis]AZL61438.1 TetR/AcrR family transcriptional regulator [Tabrizicola piscis]
MSKNEPNAIDAVKASAGRPGRPVDLHKRDHILDVARDFFFAHGVEGVSIEGIASASGVSKVTIYKGFGDKTGLFEAVVEREAEAMERGVAQLSAQGATLTEQLVAFGAELLGFLERPELAAFDRVLALEAPRRPGLAERFFNAGPGRIRASLARLIREAMQRGEIEDADPLVAAEDLIALWQGFATIEQKFLGLGARSNPDARRRRVVRAVDRWLRAYSCQD